METSRLKEHLESVIKTINKSLRKWENNGKHYDFNDLRSLAITWIVKVFRAHLSYREIKQLIKVGRPSITVASSPSSYVTGIYFFSISSDLCRRANEILDSLDYVKLHRQSLEKEEPPSEVSEISFQSINTIKF